MSLTRCLQEAGDFLPAEARDAIHKRAGELRAEGLTPNEAARQAVQDQLMPVQAKLKEVETAFKEGATLYETEPKTPAAKAEAEAAVSRVDQLLLDSPDMMVQLDGMDAPMRAADFMAAVKAEADEMAADAPLMQVAAECALLNGS